MTWTFSAPYMEYTLTLEGETLRWDEVMDDCGRPLYNSRKQSLTSFFERGPATAQFPFFETDVPLEVVDQIAADLGRSRPEWANPLPTSVLELFRLANSPSDRSAAIKQMLHSGVPADEFDCCGFTPVWYASRYGDPENTVALLEGGAEARRIFDGVRGYDTLLHAAVSRGYPYLVEKLLALKVCPNLVNSQGETALFFVQRQPALYRNTEAHVTRALLKGGADPHHRSRSGTTPLEYSRMHGLTEMEQLLAAT